VSGPDRVSLAQRAGPDRGWRRLTVELYGEWVEETYQTFPATWRPAGRLVDRSAWPWDDPTRRPSPADRRRAVQRECLREEDQAAAGGRSRVRKIRGLARRLLRMAA
jgi:hypothetical protein